MQGLSRRRFLAALVPAAVAGCTSPNPLLFTVAPVPGNPQPGGPRSVVLHQVSIARYLERSEIVQSTENYRVAVLSNQIWGEPVAQMIGRVLAEDLMQRLPGTTVYGINGAITAPEDASVEVNIQRMDKNAAGALAFSAQAAVEFSSSHRPPLTRSLDTTIPVVSPDTAGEVRAISIGVGLLADTIAAMLRTRRR